MAEKQVSTMTATEFSDQVSKGVAQALAQYDALKESHAAMLQQHAEATGQKKTDPLQQISNNVEHIRDNNNELVELFTNFSKSISMMFMPEDGMSAPSKSSLATMAASIAPSEMTMPADSVAPSGTVGSAIRNFSSSNSSIAQPTAAPVNTSEGYQEALASTGAVAERNSEATDRKALLEEEDRAYKETAKPVITKLGQAIDKYLEDKNSSAGNGADLGSSLLGLLGALGGGMVGFAAGYLGKFAEMWKNVGGVFTSAIRSGWNTLKNSKIGKTIGDLGTKFNGVVNGGIKKIGELGSKLSGAISSGIGKIGSLKNSFMNMVSGWKNTMKESVLGKAAKTVSDGAKKVGGFLSGIASKIGNGIKSAASAAGSAIKSGAEKAASAVAKSGVVQKAMKAASKGMSIGKKLPIVQAVGGLVDTASNVYKVAKAGGGITDMMTTGAAGLVDTLSDTLMIPELINAAGGAIAAAKSGKGVGGILKGAGSGFIKQRDANDISIGNGLMANLQNLVGNGTETTRRVAAAYNAGKGYDAAGVQTVSGAAGGFGHSAALFVPKAPGSMENSNTPTASVVPNLPNGQVSEADKMKAMKDGMKEGVKEALLSPEVQEANAKNAKETGAAINGQLFGG